MAAASRKLAIDADHIYSCSPVVIPGESPFVTCFNAFLREPAASQITPCKFIAIPRKGIEIRNGAKFKKLMEKWDWNNVVDIKNLPSNHPVYSNILAVATNREMHLFNVKLPFQAGNLAVQLNAYFKPQTLMTATTLPPSLPSPSSPRSPTSVLSVNADHLYSYPTTMPTNPGSSLEVTCFNAFISDNEAVPTKCKLLAIPGQGLEIYNRDPPQSFVEGWHWSQIAEIKHLGPNHFLYNNILIVTTTAEIHLFNVILPVQAINVASELNDYLGNQGKPATTTPPPSPPSTVVSPPVVSPPQNLDTSLPPLINNPAPKAAIMPQPQTAIHLSKEKPTFRIRVERETESEVLKKCLDEIQIFADQRLVQFNTALNELVALNQTTNQLNAKIYDKKTKSSERKTAQSQVAQIAITMKQLKSFVDGALPKQDDFIEIIQKVRLAFMLLSRLRHLMAANSAAVETMANGLADCFLAIAFQLNASYSPPFNILNEISMPMLTRVDVDLIAEILQQKGDASNYMWQQLAAKNWKTGVEDFKGATIPFYKPKFAGLSEPLVLRFLDPFVIREWINDCKAREIQAAAALARMEPGLQQRFKQQLLQGRKDFCQVINVQVVDRKVHLPVEIAEILEIVGDETDNYLVRNVDGESGLVPKSAVTPTQFLSEETESELFLLSSSSLSDDDDNDDELDAAAQLVFRSRLIDQGKHVGVVIKAAHNAADDFKVVQGEIVEVLCRVGLDELRIRRVNGRTGVVNRSVVLIDGETATNNNNNSNNNHSPYSTTKSQNKQKPVSMMASESSFLTKSSSYGQQQQTRRSETLSLQAAENFKAKLVDEGKRFSVAISPTKDKNSGEIVVFPGEVLEILEHVDETQTLVSNCFGENYHVRTKTLMIPFPTPRCSESITKFNNPTAKQFASIIRKRGGTPGKIIESYDGDNVAVVVDDCVEVLGEENGLTRVITADNLHGYIPSNVVSYKTRPSSVQPDIEQLPVAGSDMMMRMRRSSNSVSLTSETQQEDFARKVKMTNGILCRALENYKSERDNFTIRRGEFLEAHSKRQNIAEETWVMVTNCFNEIGFVPSNMLEQQEFHYRQHSAPSSSRSFYDRPTILRSPTEGRRKTTKSHYYASSISGQAISRRKSHYTDIQRLTAGSFGDMMTLATRKRDNKQVLIKEILLDGRDDDLVRAKATFLAKHPHQYFVEIKGYFEENGKLFVEAANYYKARTLRKAINGQLNEQDGHFAEQQIKKWLLQLSEAVEHLHGFKIVHGAIKAENVFLFNSDDVKLGDLNPTPTKFGSTKELIKVALADGTLPYIAPELCMTKHQGDTKVDIWAMGVLTYFLASLRLPFGEHTSVVSKLISKQQPSALPLSYSSKLINFVSALLIYDPATRPNIQQLRAIPFLALQ